MGYAKIVSNNNANIVVVIFVFTILSFAPNAANAETLYKWTDADGQVRYSDILPPEASKKKRTVLDHQGYTVGRVAREKTEKELAAKKKQHSEKLARERLASAQAKRDRQILHRYNNESQIIAARNRKLESINNNISLEQETLKNEQLKLSTLRRKAADFSRAQQKPPKKLLLQMKQVRQNIKRSRNAIKNRQTKIRSLNDQYKTIVVRYRNLRKNPRQETGVLPN